MTSATTTGRLVGIMMIVQAVCGALGNLVLLKPVMAAPGFLVNAAPHATTLAWAVLASLVAAAMSVAIVATAWSILRQASRAAALWLVALGAANLALNALEGVTLLTMLSLSQDYLEAAPADAGQYAALAELVRSMRYWSHYMKLMSGVAGVGVLFAMMLRAALVPRILAGLALVATALQFVAVTLPLFGNRIDFRLLAPAGVLFLGTALWLLVRGFAVPVTVDEKAVA